MEWELSGDREAPQRYFSHQTYESCRLRHEQGSAESVAVDNGSTNMRGTGMSTRHGARRMNHPTDGYWQNCMDTCPYEAFQGRVCPTGGVQSNRDGRTGLAHRRLQEKYYEQSDTSFIINLSTSTNILYYIDYKKKNRFLQLNQLYDGHRRTTVDTIVEFV
jgi:hypothetical protein